MEKNTFTLGLYRRISQKTDRPYVCLAADLGYRKIILSFDRGQIIELLGLSYSAYSVVEQDILSNNGVGNLDFFPVADIVLKDKIV